MNSKQKFTEMSIDINSLIPGVRYIINTKVESPIRPFTGTFVEYDDSGRIMGEKKGRVVNELDVRYLTFNNINESKDKMIIPINFINNASLYVNTQLPGDINKIINEYLGGKHKTKRYRKRSRKIRRSMRKRRLRK